MLDTRSGAYSTHERRSRRLAAGSVWSAAANSVRGSALPSRGGIIGPPQVTCLMPRSLVTEDAPAHKEIIRFRAGRHALKCRRGENFGVSSGWIIALASGKRQAR